MFKYILQPDIKDSYKIDKKYLEFLNIECIDLELTEFNNSEIWKLKFKDMRDQIMKNEESYLDLVTKTWVEHPDRFKPMKNSRFCSFKCFRYYILL